MPAGVGVAVAVEVGAGAGAGVAERQARARVAARRMRAVKGARRGRRRDLSLRLDGGVRMGWSQCVGGEGMGGPRRPRSGPTCGLRCHG